MSWLFFTLGTLATFRLALLVSREDGPAWIFRKLRNAPSRGSSARKGLSCTLCTSIWFAALVATFYWWTARIAGIDWPLYWLAFSAGAICLHMQFTKTV